MVVADFFLHGAEAAWGGYRTLHMSVSNAEQPTAVAVSQPTPKTDDFAKERYQCAIF
jgi:hypothetical protein